MSKLNTPATNPRYWEELDEIQNGNADFSVNLKDNPNPKPHWKGTEIDIYTPPPAQPVAIDIADDREGSVPFGSYGDISCIFGPPKNKKSYLKSAIVASYIGGNANNYFENIWGRNSKGKVVFDIDTEQGYSHAWKSTHRIKEMVGFEKNENYIPLHWREKTAAERRQLLDSIFKDEEYKGRIGVIAIDGVADFVDDVNDLKGTNELIQILLSGSSNTGAHIILVMHSNYGSKKPTGHLGSAILKKCETIAYVENRTVRNDAGVVVSIDKSIVDVHCMDSRNASFDDFSFTIDANKLPQHLPIPR